MGKIIFLAFFVSIATQLFAQDNKLQKVRIGWQIPWALQGQLVQVLKHTDIAKKQGLDIEFIGRTYGPMLNEIALAGSVDVILTADQPASILFTKDKGWKGIARLMYNRTSTYVPIKSPIKKLSELKGKTIGVPMGAAAERVTSAALKNAGLNPQDPAQVKWLNVDIREHMVLATKHEKDKSFGNIDALSGFDPTPAILEAKKLVRPLDVGKVVSLIVANREVSENKELAEKIVMAFSEAYKYYRANLNEADDWFMAEAMLADNSHEASRIAESLEPNMKKGSAVEMKFSKEDLEIFQSAADFVAKKAGKNIVVKDYLMPWALAN